MGVPSYQMFPSGGNTGGGAAPWLQDLTAGVGAAGGIYGLINSIQNQGTTRQYVGQTDPFAMYRPGYGAQLAHLMQDPGSVTSLPGYQFLMGQGVEAMDRSAAAPGGVGFGSTAEKGLLEKYGQGLADQFYQQQVQTLSGLAGANIGPMDPRAIAGALGGTSADVGRSVTGMMSPMLQLMQGLGIGQAGTPQAMSGIDSQSMQDWNTYNLYSGGTPFSGDSTYQNALAMMGGAGNPAGDFAGFPSASPGIPYDQGATGDSLDLSGMFSFKGAGGQAATGGMGTGMQMGGGLAGIGLDLASGRPGAAIASAATLASRFGGFDPQVAKNLGLGGAAGGDILGIIQGIKAGGFSGGAQAGIDAARLGVLGGQASGLLSSGTAGELGGALGYAAVPLSIYNFAKNWQGGAVGSDALQGASTGAAIGSVIPGVGTLIGAGVGALVGGVSGLMGNAGEREAALSHQIDASINKLPGGQQISAASGMSGDMATKYIQSIMSARTNTPGHSTGLEMAFGRNNVAGFTKAMDAQLASALRGGKIQPGMTPDKVYSSVIAPWLKSKGASLDIGTRDSAGNDITNTLTGAVQALIRQWMYGG